VIGGEQGVSVGASGGGGVRERGTVDLRESVWVDAGVTNKHGGGRCWIQGWAPKCMAPVLWVPLS
jgi:hypothetical protein